MKVTMRKVSEVKPYEKNPRRNDGAVDAVAASIREFGFQQPLVVDKDGVLIAGHTRLKAAKKLGLKEVPVVVADGLSPEQVKAYRLADNKTGQLSEWDFITLQEELNELVFDMEQFGFAKIDCTEEYINTLLSNDGCIGGGISLERETFNVTFTFSKDYEEPLLDYIKNNGKENLVNAILKEAGGCLIWE